MTLLAALLVPMIVLLGLVRILRTSANWVDHSDRVIAEANHVEKLLFTMQSGIRGYRLLNDPTLLGTYVAARNEIPERLEMLGELVNDNPEQAATVAQLRKDADGWIKFAESSLAENPLNTKPTSRNPAALNDIASAVERAHAVILAEVQVRMARDSQLNRVFGGLVALLVLAAAIGIPILSFWLQRVLREVGGSYRAAELRLRESEWRLRFLNDLGNATRALAEPEEIMAATMRLLGHYLRASRCAYAEVAPDGEHFTIFKDYADGCASLMGEYQLSNFGAKIAAELRAGQTLVIRNFNTQSAYAESAASFGILEIKATVCFPLLKNGELRSLMAVHQKTPRDWTDIEVSLVAEVAERCWATIEGKRAESALRQAQGRAAADAQTVAESAERFRLLSEVGALQVWTATLQGELDYANQECTEYFGARAESEILGNAWAQFVHSDDLPLALRAWTDSVASGNPYEVEFRLRRSDGVFRWFLVRAQAMRDADGQIVKWFGTNTDIDDLKSARDAAERASHAKDDFLAALSHELRTPLTPVLMTAASLRADDRLPFDAREQLGMIERNIALEARLIDDLLDLTAISRGKLLLRSEPCDAHSLIGLAVEIVRSEARAKDISIERSLNADHCGLTADPARFQQVIWNLLRNAVKFTPRGGKIRIFTREETTSQGALWLRIEISDSGIGIDPSLLDQIFVPFDQGGLTGDHRFGGIGLGLTIARAIVDMHGGRISAQSAGENHGSTFVVELPGAIERPTGVGGTASPWPGPNSSPRKPLRLLLVEDHENTLQTLLRLLQGDGHSVTTATTLGEALAAAEAGEFDLVVSDLGLPDGTGIELMQKLREDHALRGIALSGYGMEEDIARSREAGFLAHLVKPVHFAELKRVIDGVSPR